MAVVQFLNGDNDASVDAVNAFRLRADATSSNSDTNGDATAGFFPYQRMDTKYDSVTKSLVADGTYLAIQNRNANFNKGTSTTHKDDISITMKADCTVNPRLLPEKDRGIRLAWSDADAINRPGLPAAPYNPEINWELKNLRTGQVMTGNLRAFWTGKASTADYVGGQGEDRDDLIPWNASSSAGYGTFAYEAGDRIEWTWKNVLANNGLQVQLPFEDDNIGGSCPYPNNSARCDVSGVPDIIAPGETKAVRVRVRNGGFSGQTATSTWPLGGNFKLGSGTYPVPAGSTADDNGAYRDSSFWNASKIPGKNDLQAKTRILVSQTIYPESLYPDQTSLATFEFNITAPNDKSGSWPFVWQMLQEGVERFGEVCVKPIKIVENRPILRIEGSDVIAGAVFGVNGATGAESCTARRQQYTRAGTAGDVKTNGLDVETGYGTGMYWAGWHGFSSSQYAVFARSEVASGKSYSKNNFAANDGFMRGTTTKYRDLIFANNNTNRYGYFYADSNVSLPCIDVSSLDTSYTATNADNISSTTITNASADGAVKYYKSASSITLATSSGELPIIPGQRIVIETEGSVTINARIRYTSLGFPNAEGNSSAPLLMIIAKGGILVDGNVNQLDGYYVAYNSTFNTCLQNDRSTIGVCSTRLVVNGAIAAQKILWGRHFGTLGVADESVESGASGGVCSSGTDNTTKHAVFNQVNGNNANLRQALADCSAEYVKFSPEFYFANPFTQQRKAGVSNIPEGSIELPPIY
jgi:hypothetical protein